MDPSLHFQPSLLDEAPAAGATVDESFVGLTRVHLDATAWVDHQRGWVSGSDDLFADLVAGKPWRQRSRHMYGNRVDEPRLTWWWRDGDGPLEPAVLERMRAVLSARYGVTLDSCGLNLYRDGRDGVAWHGDRIAKEIAEPVVAIVSLGEPRAFLLRPKGGLTSHTYHLDRGDLLVTGGTCQRSWQHTVPKVAAAGPRISVTFRHGLAYPGETTGR